MKLNLETCKICIFDLFDKMSVAFLYLILNNDDASQLVQNSFALYYWLMLYSVTL